MIKLILKALKYFLLTITIVLIVFIIIKPKMYHKISIIVGSQIQWFGFSDYGNKLIKKSVIKFDSIPANIYHLISVQNTKNGNYDQSSKYLKEAVALNQMDHQGYYGWILLYLYRDYPRALSELMAYNALTPNFTDYVGDDNILYAMGLCYKGLGDYKNALHYFDSAIEDEISTHSESWVSHNMYFQKARTLHLMGLYDQAIEFYNKTLDSWDGASEAVFYRGIAYKDKHDIERACKEFNISFEMLNKGSKSSDSYVALFDEVFLSQISDTLKYYCRYE